MSSLIILIKQEQGTSVTLEMIRLRDKKFDRQQCVVLFVFMFYVSKSLNLAFNVVLLAFYGVKRVKFILPSFEMSWLVVVTRMSERWSYQLFSPMTL